jgi:hypothetical protein
MTDATKELQLLKRAAVTFRKKLDDYFNADGSTGFSSLDFPIHTITESNNILQLRLSDFLYAINKREI